MKFFVMWLIWEPFRVTASRLPVRFTRTVAKWTGNLAYLSLGRSRSNIKKDLAQGFSDISEKDLARIAKKSFQSWFLAEFENVIQKKLVEKGTYKSVQIEGREYLDAALAKGRGVLLVIAHFGAYLQVLPALGYNGYSMNQVANELPTDAEEKDKPAGFFARRTFLARDRYSGRFLAANMLVTSKFMRPLFARLKANEVVVIAVDGIQNGKSGEYPFLGYSSHRFSEGPFAIAEKTGAALVPAFVIRDENGENKIAIEPEMSFSDMDGSESAVRKKTGEFVRILEKYAKKYPDHYGMAIFFQRKG